VHLTVEGSVATADGKPVANAPVEILVTDSYPARVYVTTGSDGRFSAKLNVLADWLETLLTVEACFRGDDLLLPSCDTQYARIPPNWKVILMIAGAAAVIILLIIIAITVTGG